MIISEFAELTKQNVYIMDTFAQDIFNSLEELNRPERLVLRTTEYAFVPTPFEMTLPATVTVPPSGGNRKAPYENFMRQHNIQVPSGMNIAELSTRIRTVLVNILGYQRVNDTTYQRDRGLHIIREPATPVIRAPLPDTINMTIFSTIKSMNDFVNSHELPKMLSLSGKRSKEAMYNELNHYLISQGYVYDPSQRALIRTQGRSMGPQVTTYRDVAGLITADRVIQLLSGDPIVVSQATYRSLCHQ